MKEHNSFESLDKLSGGISYVQTAIARISGFLLMLGLVVSMANMLLKDAVFSSAPVLQGLWAWSQALAVDANLSLVFVAFFRVLRERDWVRVAAYGAIGFGLLFVAVTITDIESVRQALDTSLSLAAIQVHVPLLLLTQVRSVVAVLLVAVGGLDVLNKRDQAPKSEPETETATDQVEAIKEEKPKRVKASSNGHGAKVQEYLMLNPQAETRDVVAATGANPEMVRRYKRQMANERPIQVEAVVVE